MRVPVRPWDAASPLFDHLLGELMRWPHNEPAVPLSQSERAPQIFFFLLASAVAVSSPLAVLSLPRCGCFHSRGIDEAPLMD